MIYACTGTWMVLLQIDAAQLTMQIVNIVSIFGHRSPREPVYSYFAISLAMQLLGARTRINATCKGKLDATCALSFDVCLLYTYSNKKREKIQAKSVYHRSLFASRTRDSQKLSKTDTPVAKKTCETQSFIIYGPQFCMMLLRRGCGPVI